ncbi:MAG: AEC family transporter [Bacillota bacterium]
MDFNTVIEQILILLLACVIGIIAYRAGVFEAGTTRKLADIVINITMPCMIVGTVTSGQETMSAGDVLSAFWPMCLVYVIGAAAALALAYLTRVKKEQFGTYAFMVIFPNVGFMGFPVVLSLFGERAATYLALMQIPFSLLAYTLGVYLLAGKHAFCKDLWRTLLSPALVSPVIGILMYLLGIRLPAFIDGALDLIGRSTTPLAMIVMGASIAAMSIKSIRNLWRIALAGIVRLLAVPVLVWLALRGLVKDDLLLGVITVLMAMPCATNTTFMSIKYGGDQELAAQGVFLSTVLSAVTIPLLIYLLLM